MKPHAAYPAGRVDAAKRTLSKPLHSAAYMRMCSRVGAVHRRPSLHRVYT
jgi:hypothetical protein